MKTIFDAVESTSDISSKVCEICQTVFKPIQETQRFCCLRCKRKHNNKVYNQRKSRIFLKQGTIVEPFKLPEHPEHLEDRIITNSVLGPISELYILQLPITNNKHEHLVVRRSLRIDLSFCPTCSKRENRIVLISRSPGRVVLTTEQRQYRYWKKRYERGYRVRRKNNNNT